MPGLNSAATCCKSIRAGSVRALDRPYQCDVLGRNAPMTNDLHANSVEGKPSWFDGTLTVDKLRALSEEVKNTISFDLASGATGAERTAFAQYQYGYSYSGMQVIQSVFAVTEEEDWSKVRSPSRARRRIKRGFRQNIVKRQKPAAFKYGETLIVHPQYYSEIASRVSDYVDKKLKDQLKAGWL